MPGPYPSQRKTFFRASSILIIDVYIYGDYKVLNASGHAVPYEREGSRIAEVEGKPDLRQTISDLLETRVGRLAICGKRFELIELQ
jgi:hypothetical protein